METVSYAKVKELRMPFLHPGVLRKAVLGTPGNGKKVKVLTAQNVYCRKI
jgi:hypothetical protein